MRIWFIILNGTIYIIYSARIDTLGHSSVFTCICFASFENPKTYQPAREKNKEKITKSMQIFQNSV
jgi:hypothetical protein